MVRCSVDLAIPAFLGSFYATADLVSFILPSRKHGSDLFVAEALDIWEKQVGSSPPPEADNISAWDEACIDKSWIISSSLPLTLKQKFVY